MVSLVTFFVGAFVGALAAAVLAASGRRDLTVHLVEMAHYWRAVADKGADAGEDGWIRGQERQLRLCADDVLRLLAGLPYRGNAAGVNKLERSDEQ